MALVNWITGTTLKGSISILNPTSCSFQRDLKVIQLSTFCRWSTLTSQTAWSRVYRRTNFQASTLERALLFQGPQIKPINWLTSKIRSLLMTWIIPCQESKRWLLEILHRDTKLGGGSPQSLTIFKWKYRSPKNSVRWKPPISFRLRMTMMNKCH